MKNVTKVTNERTGQVVFFINEEVLALEKRWDSADGVLVYLRGAPNRLFLQYEDLDELAETVWPNLEKLPPKIQRDEADFAGGDDDASASDAPSGASADDPGLTDVCSEYRFGPQPGAPERPGDSRAYRSTAEQCG